MVVNSKSTPLIMEYHGLRSNQYTNNKLRYEEEIPERRTLRRGRRFSAEATRILQDVFSRTRHPLSSEMQQLAEKLGLQEK